MSQNFEEAFSLPKLLVCRAVASRTFYKLALARRAYPVVIQNQVSRVLIPTSEFFKKKMIDVPELIESSAVLRVRVDSAKKFTS